VRPRLPRVQFVPAFALDANPPTDAELARRFRSGDESAAALLYRRYAARLRAAVRSRCGRTFASRFDPDDVTQAAFRALFEQLRATDPEGEVWSLLLGMAMNTVRRLIEHHSAAKRSVRRTRPAEDDGRPLPVPDHRCGDALRSIALREQLESLPEPDRHVVELRLAGYEVGEITSRTGRARRTVERVLQMFREQVRAAGSHF
jgi:RNA polymerase sigma factor (sigma-70 family)